MRKFILQPKATSDGVLPYPYIVSERGFVGRQKFWRGKPKKLLGFNSTPVAGDMNVVTFLNKPVIAAEDMMLGINRYPVFEDDEGGWFTLGIEIEKVTEVVK